jgi:hypothetical protein
MPVYNHSCAHCGANCEIQYEMKYVGDEANLPKEIKQQISCNPKTCKSKLEGKGKMSFRYGGSYWPRVPYAPHIANVIGGVTVTEGDLLKQKQDSRKARSRVHFKNEILPKLAKEDKRMFDRSGKYKNIKGDHEKMKAK